MATEPLTPLSRFPSYTLTPRPLSRALLALPSVRLLDGLGRVGGCGEPPRPPLTPTR